MIEAQIFKIWIGDKPTPEHFKQFTDTWAINKGFKVHEVNVCKYSSPFLDWAKQTKQHTLINHYLRCKLLYDFGGVYLDLDIACVKSLRPLLNTAPLTLGIEDADIVNNAVIIAEKEHPFLKECLIYMDSFLFDKKEVELETGPRMFTTLMKKRGWRPGHIGEFKGVEIKAPEYFYPFHYTEDYSQDCITGKTFTVHHWANSWGEQKPLVSVIIPCYKQSHFLDEAIKSALQQTYKNVEVVVVNDGSPDAKETQAVVARYRVEGHHNVSIVNQVNKGLSGARNAGIRASRGQYILPLDADDKLSKYFIEKTIGKADIVSTYLRTFGDTNERWTPPVAVPEFKHFIKHNCINCCALMTREVFEKTGGYDEKMLTGYEDWEFWTHAAKLGFKFYIQPEELFFYRRHGKTMFHDALSHHVPNTNYIRSKHK